jgi:hypothetical protein
MMLRRVTQLQTASTKIMRIESATGQTPEKHLTYAPRGTIRRAADRARARG